MTGFRNHMAEADEDTVHVKRQHSHNLTRHTNRPEAPHSHWPRTRRILKTLFQLAGIQLEMRFERANKCS